MVTLFPSQVVFFPGFKSWPWKPWTRATAKALPKKTSSPLPGSPSGSPTWKIRSFIKFKLTKKCHSPFVFGWKTWKIQAHQNVGWKNPISSVPSATRPQRWSRATSTMGAFRLGFSDDKCWRLSVFHGSNKRQLFIIFLIPSRRFSRYSSLKSQDILKSRIAHKHHCSTYSIYS